MHVTYFQCFGVEYIPKQNRKFFGNKNNKTNIYRIHACNWTMCGYFCIRFIDFMLKGKSLLDYTNLFSRNEYKKSIRNCTIKSEENINQEFRLEI